MPSAPDLVLYLRAQRFPVSTEKALQDAIESALVAGSFAYEREYRLDVRNRIDFLLAGNVGLEAKARHPRRKTLRQLERYVEFSEIDALVLVSATFTGLPETINGKPIFFVSTGRAAF